MAAALITLDLVLLVLSTGRLIRLVTVDEITDALIHRHLRNAANRAAGDGGPRHGRRRARLVFWLDFLECPFCIGFWIGAANLVGFWLLGGPGDLHIAARLVLGALAFNYLIGHVSSRLDT